MRSYYNLPIYFLLARYPEKFQALVVHGKSFGIIFHYDMIDCLNNEDVKGFFEDTYSQVDMNISDEALDMVTSSGLPIMMHQIE